MNDGRFFAVKIETNKSRVWKCCDPLSQGDVLFLLDEGASRDDAELLAERYKTGHGRALEPYLCQCGETHEKVIDGRSKYGPTTAEHLKTVGGRYASAGGKVQRNSSGRRGLHEL